MASYKLNEEKMFCDITDGIAIVINSETGIYYGMNNFGTSVFENIVKGIPSESVLAAAKAMPGAPADIETKFADFMKFIEEKGLVVAGDPSSAAPVLAAADNSFVPNVTEYSDAQELLLADPIHDVKDETGWAPEKSALEDDPEKAAAKKEKEAIVQGKA